MPVTCRVTGNISQPILRQLNSGSVVLNFGIGATHRKKDQNSGEWNDVGEELWINVSFWDEKAERLAAVSHKGSKVCVEGILVRKKYKGHTNLELSSPFFIESVSLSAHTDSNSDPWSTQENYE